MFLKTETSELDYSCKYTKRHIDRKNVLRTGSVATLGLVIMHVIVLFSVLITKVTYFVHFIMVVVVRLFKSVILQIKLSYLNIILYRNTSHERSYPELSRPKRRSI